MAEHPLTQRERYILKKVAAGMTEREIAVRTIISVGTVRTHIEHVRRKLSARTRAQAVAIALRKGLIE